MQLTITVEGSDDDIEFLRARAVGAIEDLIAEYDHHLDEPVELSWELGE